METSHDRYYWCHWPTWSLCYCRDVELIKDENNPFYDANRAAKQALSFFIVKHCSVYFLKELVDRGMLADAQTKSLTSPERGKAIIQDNWKFLSRYFIREYPDR